MGARGEANNRVLSWVSWCVWGLCADFPLTSLALVLNPFELEMVRVGGGWRRRTGWSEGGGVLPEEDIPIERWARARHVVKFPKDAVLSVRLVQRQSLVDSLMESWLTLMRRARCFCARGQDGVVLTGGQENSEELMSSMGNKDSDEQCETNVNCIDKRGNAIDPYIRKERPARPA